MNCDHIKRLVTLTSDNIKRLSLYFKILYPIKIVFAFRIMKSRRLHKNEFFSISVQKFKIDQTSYRIFL
jgi:hypothetical protein